MTGDAARALPAPVLHVANRQSPHRRSTVNQNGLRTIPTDSEPIDAIIPSVLISNRGNAVTRHEPVSATAAESAR
jgi:hypothetical protein